MATTTSSDVMPTGKGIFTTVPDLFFLPEFISIIWTLILFPFFSVCLLIIAPLRRVSIQVFGGLVWTLVASTLVDPQNPLGWVMFVSVFCFVGTTLWFFIFLCGGNQSSVWPAVDVGFHFVSAVFYLSASVELAYITILNGVIANVLPANIALPITEDLKKNYRLEIAAVVMSFVATLLYFLHAIFSAIRWKRS